MIDDRIIYQYHIAQMNASNNAQGHNLEGGGGRETGFIRGSCVVPRSICFPPTVKFSKEIKGNLLNWLFERNK
jgi:hypothetical protein